MIRIHTTPDTEPLNGDFSVWVNGMEVNPYSCRVSAAPLNTWDPRGMTRPLMYTEIASVVSLEADESVQFAVKSNGRLFSKAEVRPRSKSIVAQTDGDEIRFTLAGSGQYVLELDDCHRALHIFINAADDFGVDPGAADVLYFPPGVHFPGIIEMYSGQTVYIDAGAVVYGAIRGVNVSDVRVVGYGILDGSWEARTQPGADHLRCFYNPAGGTFPEDEASLRGWFDSGVELATCVRFYNSERITVQGVTFRDSSFFVISPTRCDELVFDNVKLVGMWRTNTDGIDLLNCRQVTVRNSFLRNFDDCLCIKGTKGWDNRNCENIHVENCVLWCDWGRALEFGAETCADAIRDIVFENCDIIHGADVMMDIQNGDRAEIYDVTFRDIRCEYTASDYRPRCNRQGWDVPEGFPERGNSPQLFVIDTKHRTYAKDYAAGSVHGVTVENIRILADEGMEMPRSLIEAGDEAPIDHVVLRNIFFNGRRLQSMEEAGITVLGPAGDVRFE